ncbi:MAG: hypothetical protein ABEJ72_08775, partial [Candidatus Aenigmatarchaeota archaeon]
MAFDLEADEVRELRQKYEGRNPQPERVIGIAEKIQDEYIDGRSAVVGGITTYKGIQSTKTRRDLSPSVDLVVDSADFEALGEEYDSWEYAGAYFADVDDVEIAVIPIREFQMFNFPSSVVEESYLQEVEGSELRIGEPESNFVSKFNRVVETAKGESEVEKGSDIIDSASHLHWGKVEDGMDIRKASRMAREHVE